MRTQQQICGGGAGGLGRDSSFVLSGRAFPGARPGTVYPRSAHMQLSGGPVARAGLLPMRTSQGPEGAAGSWLY